MLYFRVNPDECGYSIGSKGIGITAGFVFSASAIIRLRASNTLSMLTLTDIHLSKFLSLHFDFKSQRRRCINFLLLHLSLMNCKIVKV